jgi:hypothetical protein
VSFKHIPANKLEFLERDLMPRRKVVARSLSLVGIDKEDKIVRLDRNRFGIYWDEDKMAGTAEIRRTGQGLPPLDPR